MLNLKVINSYVIGKVDEYIGRYVSKTNNKSNIVKSDDIVIVKTNMPYVVIEPLNIATQTNSYTHTSNYTTDGGETRSYSEAVEITYNIRIVGEDENCYTTIKLLHSKLRMSSNIGDMMEDGYYITNVDNSVRPIRNILSDRVTKSYTFNFTIAVNDIDADTNTETPIENVSDITFTN